MFNFFIYLYMYCFNCLLTLYCTVLLGVHNHVHPTEMLYFLTNIVFSFFFWVLARGEMKHHPLSLRRILTLFFHFFFSKGGNETSSLVCVCTITCSSLGWTAIQCPPSSWLVDVVLLDVPHRVCVSTTSSTRTIPHQ